MALVDDAFKSSLELIICRILNHFDCRNHLNEELPRETIFKPEARDSLSIKEKYIHSKVTCFLLKFPENRKRVSLELGQMYSKPVH